MAAACCRFDDGQRRPANCFPARTLLGRRKDGAGHWLVSYRKAEEGRCRRVQRRTKEQSEEFGKSRSAGGHHGSVMTLDAAMLLRLHCVDKPSELSSVNVSELQLDSVSPDELQVFDNVAYIDASDNLLTLNSFRCFASLRELNLSVNRICNMMFDASDFPQLQVLDLSYNSVSADAIVSIGFLPRLKVLHLTGNGLRHLPSPSQLTLKGADSQFRALEVLMLDDNKLSSGVFHSLRNLGRLKYLNVRGNRVSEVPYLQPPGNSDSTEEQTEDQAPDPQDDGDKFLKHVRAWSSWILQNENLQGGSRESSLPFPELQSLNLSNNSIAEEGAVMAVALFPTLRELDIHSNPLTTRRSRDPPLLTHCLQERLDIRINRREPRDARKPLLKLSADPKWKVKEKILKLPKKSVLMEKREVIVQQSPDFEVNNGDDDNVQENTENFFVTQVENLSDCDFDLKTDEDENPEDGYHDTSMAAEADANVARRVGIQTAVRMLEHTLKNLNVYRDSKPTFDRIQMPYREREKRIKELPPLKATKPPFECVDQMLDQIRHTSSVRGVSLGSAMHDAGVDSKEHKEVLSLLKDMEAKYEMVHRKQAAKLKLS